MTLLKSQLAGLEVVALKVADIDSARMIIRVEQGKGRKDRYMMLSPRAPGGRRRGRRAGTFPGATRCSH